MGDGKRGLCPCGHYGEAVIGQYYACRLCDNDSVPEEVLDRVTEPLCENCGSDDLDVYPLFTVSGKTVIHCRSCKHTFP